MRFPERRCSHAYGMIYDDDYCCCTGCEQEWVMSLRGWKPLVDSEVFEYRARPKKNVQRRGIQVGKVKRR